MKKAHILFVYIHLCLLILGAYFAQAQESLSASQWQEDLHFMMAELELRHKNLYHSTPKEVFERAVQELDVRIPDLERHEIIVEMARITSLIGDSHSGIRLFSDEAVGFRSIPVRFYVFEEGLFIRSVDHRMADLAGARVLKIGKAVTSEAVEAVRPLIPRDNEMYTKVFAPFYLSSPEILHAVGLIDKPDLVTLEVEKDNNVRTVSLEPAGTLMLTGHALHDSGMEHITWVDARDGAEHPTPLWLKEDPRNAFWFEYLPEHRMVYAQINEIQDKEEESLEAFSSRMFTFVRDHPVDRVVLDLRLNRGGNNYLTRALVKDVIRTEKIDRQGGFFCIIGRRTHSAAQSLVNRLENYTEVVFVGEPTSQQVNHYGDNVKIVLPNSGLTVRASYLWWQDMDPRDTRRWTAPDLAVDLRFEDYRQNIDPVMKAILNYVPRPDLMTQLREAAEAGRMNELVPIYDAFKADPANRYADTRGLVNRIGYMLLQEGLPELALTFFQRNVQAYPDYANGYDSLAEAYLSQGNTEQAVINYKRALELDPANLNAARILEELQRR